MEVKKKIEKTINLKTEYKNTVHRIKSQINELEMRFHSLNRKFVPTISKKVQNNLISCLDNAKKIVVNNISLEVNTLIAPFSNEDYSDTIRKGKRFSKKVVEILEESFNGNRYPDEIEKLKLAKICHISTRQVNNWFTNKRNRSKYDEQTYDEFY